MMSDPTINIKDSAEEWSNTPPDFQNNVDIEQSQKHVLKKKKEHEQRNEDNISTSDLTMDFLQEHEKKTQIRNVMIKNYTKIGDHIVYNIDVHIKERSWTLSRRYREFHQLHEQLVQVHGLAWELLPPKKIVGNLSPNHIEKRRTALQKYLKTIITVFGDLPKPLVRFLEVDQFDVHAVCQQLARDMYEIGDDLLAKQLIFKISPLQIHCINRRLQLPLPTCESNNPADDIGHLYSFIQQIPNVLIFPGSQKNFNGNHELNYDLSIFRSLTYIEIQCCDLEFLEGVESIQKHVTEVRVHKSLQLLKDFLIGSQYWEQGILMTISSDDLDNTNQISRKFPSWTKCKRASFSYNDIRSIDYSIALLPKVECLDLSHNLLTEVEYLDQLLYLSDLNLSYNELRYLAEFSYKIPSVSCLNLAGNGIQNIEGLDKLYCLEKLNIGNNRLKWVKNVLILGNLPLLKRLRVQGNPFTETGNYRVRILGQFGDRASEIVLDGYPTSNREMSRVREIVAAQNSYDVIDDELFQHKEELTHQTSSSDNKTDSTLLPSVQGGVDAKPVHSPRTKRKERVAQIANIAGKKRDEEKNLNVLEAEDEEFRQKIEKLRQHAGESWLTVYNEMADDKKQQKPPANPSIQKKKANKKIKQRETVEKNVENERSLSLSVTGPTPQQKMPKFARPLSVEGIDFEFSDELRKETKTMINNDVSVFEETYLASATKNDGEEKEYLIAVDLEEDLLTKIDFETGSTVHNYHLDSVRGVIVDEEPDYTSNIQFEAKIHKKNVKPCDISHSLVKLTTRTLRDAAGLYLVLKGCSDGLHRRTGSKVMSVCDVSNVCMENPYSIPNDLLLKFFQSFIRKTNNANKETNPSACNPTQHTNYENINIGLSFLKHVDGDSSPQNILSVLWVGCLPYLFPDEEIPVCLVMTTLNIFLFRIFHPSEDDETLFSSNKSTLSDMTALQEAMHCFYSFPLRSLGEVVVGLFDQGLRLEVQEEGARGTFVILTRDANKTGQFLDILTSIVSVKTGKKEFDVESNGEDSMEHKVNIVYPDESKINALKAQLQEQEISPLGNRENVISYCIVYQVRDKQIRQDDYDDVSSFYLRSMILTNMRIFLCDEDYVHWPLPSYIHAAPFTPQWIVDDVDKVENVIGVDVWEDSKGNMAGNYGLSLTFEGNTQQTPSSDLEGSSALVWNIMFKSLSEREQLVRSLASIWKNSFGQDLKVTKSNFRKHKQKACLPLWKGHAKKPSGNITIPSHQSLDSPEMFANIDRARLNELFRNKIAQGDDATVTGVQHVVCVGCKPYNYPDVELSVAVLLGKYNIYLICSSHDRKYLLANTHFEDLGSSTSLYITSIKIADLQQVVVGLFDQCLRLETGFPEATFVLVTRDFDRTNDLIQRLSQVILALPKQMNVIEGGGDDETCRRTVAEIFQLYKQENEDVTSTNYYPKSEFIHPNSNIRFVYPSDELLEKLRVKIHDFIQLMELFPTENDFGILLYSLIFQTRDTVDIPYTMVISELFVCLINEDHVSYPLPLFVKELPERTQYEISDVRLISSLVRVEFSDFHSGSLTLIFNADAVDPSKYGDRFKMGSVEGEMCYVTDVNSLPPAANTDESCENKEEENITSWEVKAYSYAEREKIFNVLSKMWNNISCGGCLPVIRSKK